MATSAQRMVAEQLIPHGVTDERVLRVMVPGISPGVLCVRQVVVTQP